MGVTLHGNKILDPPLCLHCFVLCFVQVSTLTLKLSLTTVITSCVLGMCKFQLFAGGLTTEKLNIHFVVVANHINHPQYN